MPNRLANETSPYLLQHQNNPVDWYPWGAEAFEKAHREDKPIFLSVGYSSCHWCHVMEHESFEDDSIAEKLNRDFICIKVDREERPDVDEAYMTAVQLSVGRGGWPMSVFLTPDYKPFFAGTYFPKEERDGHPGFEDVLQQVAQIWESDRAKVQQIANQYAEAITQSVEREAPPTEALSPALLDECVRSLSMDFDEDHGGFGKAPKFPPHTAIEFLLNYAISDFGEEELRQTAADMALFTLEKMAMGGLHDQVGGGFHRYSTDERWLLPHFEKMLYDNALLLGNYSRAAALCHGQLPELEELFSRASEALVRWLREEMVSPEGLFYSALDADSEGEEGKYYIWSEEELRAVLGPEASTFSAAFQFHPSGNFRDEATGEVTGFNIPHLLEDIGDRFEKALGKLREARKKRIRPGLDDKVLVGWNGLMIGALSESAEVALAERAAQAILDAEKAFGGLPHQIAKGKPSGHAFLEDYACLIDGLISLAGLKSLIEEETGEVRGRAAIDWLEEARRLIFVMIDRFYDQKNGGFFSTSEGHETLFGRSKPAFDQPIPSANAIAAKCLIELGDEERALKTIRSLAGWMERAPAATEALHLAYMGLIGDSEEDEFDEDSDDSEDVEERQDGEEERRDVVVALASNRLKAQNGVAQGTLSINIPSGLHINSSKPPARWLVPTEVSIEPLEFRVSYPEAPNDRYEGRVEIPFEVSLPSNSRGEEFELRVKFQACTESECQLPQEKTLSGIVEAST